MKKKMFSMILGLVIGFTAMFGTGVNLNSIFTFAEEAIPQIELPTEEITMYLDKDMYLSLDIEETIKWISSDDRIVDMDDTGLAHPLSEGTVTITAASDSFIKEFKVNVTTYNNGRDVKYDSIINELGWLPTNNKEYWEDANAEYVKNNINTITDMIQYLRERWFFYDPSYHIVATNTMWSWAMDASATIEAGCGVCCDVANVAHYVLRHDFEKAGFVLETGSEGHIYNWFFEDGWYYVMDFTEVISDLSYNPNPPSIDYYQNNIKKFKNWEEFLDLKNPSKEHWERYNNIILATYVIDATNLEECPPSYQNYMQRNITTMGDETCVVKFEEGVNVFELFVGKKWNYKLEFVPTEELPFDVPSIHEEYNQQRWMFSY